MPIQRVGEINYVNVTEFRLYECFQIKEFEPNTPELLKRCCMHKNFIHKTRVLITCIDLVLGNDLNLYY